MDDLFYGIIESLDISLGADGVLSGKTFVAKDLFDLAGYRTGAGNPDWKQTHDAAKQSAVVLQFLLDSGARLVGKSCTDELAFSLDGINIHYGTPVNSNFLGCIPGGSSSGSASAVSAGLCDFAIGTDTAGSVRVPSAYCGIFGMRPTHGRISTAGVVPLGPSFDTVGWMSRSPAILSLVGKVLLDTEDFDNREFPENFVFVKECMSILDKELLEPFVDTAEMFLATDKIETIALPENALEQWAKLFDAIRAFEAWQQHGAWVQSVSPRMAEPIKNRLLACSATTRPEYDEACRQREKVIEFLKELLRDRILCVPPIWNYPPDRDASEDDLAFNRRKNLLLNSIASLGGLPQIVIPVSLPDSAHKFAISLISGRGQDENLLDLALQRSNAGAIQ